MPDIIKQVPSGGAGQKARGVGQDIVNTTYGVGLLVGAYALVRYLERKARETKDKVMAKTEVKASAAPASGPFPGAI